MMSKYTSTIYFLLTALVVITLFSGAVRAEVSPNYSATQTVMLDISSLGGCGFNADVKDKAESGCCEPGGSCFEKQCCNHVQTSNTALVETTVRSYNASSQFAQISSISISYNSTSVHSLYRPPIA
ncbi:hypothetical protein L4D20_17115 [Vibrio kyushuensis]|uniref:hypothetical protein n=1 Tax=Vibrio kyushuensis TaxID=2910249 RepID=UPI003D0E4A81